MHVNSTLYTPRKIIIKYLDKRMFYSNVNLQLFFKMVFLAVCESHLMYIYIAPNILSYYEEELQNHIWNCVLQLPS